MSPLDFLSHFAPPPPPRRSILDMEGPEPPWLRQLRQLRPVPRAFAAACLIALDVAAIRLAPVVIR